MTSSDAVTNVFHDSLCLSNLLVKHIDLKSCVSQNLKKKCCVKSFIECKKCSIGLRATVSAAARRCACFFLQNRHWCKANI